MGRFATRAKYFCFEPLFWVLLCVKHFYLESWFLRASVMAHLLCWISVLGSGRQVCNHHRDWRGHRTSSWCLVLYRILWDICQKVIPKQNSFCSEFELRQRFSCLWGVRGPGSHGALDKSVLLYDVAGTYLRLLLRKFILVKFTCNHYIRIVF